MNGESNLQLLLKTMKPCLNEGDYVFCKLTAESKIPYQQAVCSFHEDEATTVIIKKDLADKLQFEYAAVFAWITLTVHSSLEAVGLTAAFSNALAKEGISCNVVAAFYHDHIFVGNKDAAKAMDVLNWLANNTSA
ncbi:MAG: ACT domain-containing protein [Chitinophagaceae bacterium]